MYALNSENAERAVSTVIGVVLMVAVTVILAAVIGTFVFDIGQESGEASPQASLTVEADAETNNVTISHEGGDDLHASDSKVIFEKGSESVTFDSATSGVTLEVSHTAVVNISDPQSSFETLDWDGDGTEDFNSSSDEISPLSEGDRITVRIIDIPTERIIFETEVLV